MLCKFLCNLYPLWKRNWVKKFVAYVISPLKMTVWYGPYKCIYFPVWLRQSVSPSTTLFVSFVFSLHCIESNQIYVLWLEWTWTWTLDMAVNISLYNYSSQNRWIPVAIFTDLPLKYYHSDSYSKNRSTLLVFHSHSHKHTMDKMLTTKCATIAFQYTHTPPTLCTNQHFSLAKPCDVFNSYIVTNVIRYNLALDFVQWCWQRWW